jgi:hypothetical protein
MESQLPELHAEGQRLLKLDRIELELRYTDWVAKVNLVLAEVAPQYEAQVRVVEANALSSLHQRTTQIVALLELFLSRADSA